MCDIESSVNLASSGSIQQHFVAIAMASVAQVNTFKNVFNLHDYDVGPSYLGNETFRGLRDLHGECLPLLNTYGKLVRLLAVLVERCYSGYHNSSLLQKSDL